MDTAPVILFVYNRPWHTCQTIEALKKNELANQSDLIVFSDAAKNAEAVPQVQEVRECLKTITGFKFVRVVEREENWGLAKSIIQGVTEVVDQYGKVIVLEDDVVTSPAFLQFMNQALDFYEKEKKVWHISGWNYPISAAGLDDTYCWRVMNCWGWATWADRWAHFEKNPNRIVEQWSKQKKNNFDLNGSRVFWPQIEANVKGRINTWAIFWYATIFENGGVCLNPSVSYVQNIGHDGSGVHCGSDSVHMSEVLNDSTLVDFTTDLSESELAVKRVMEFYNNQKQPFSQRLVNKVSRTLLGRNLIQ